MSKKSEYVKRSRRENFDRVSVLIAKGGHQLLRVLALRENVSVAEFIRRAILARAGLKLMPKELDDLADVDTQPLADYAVRRFQNIENADEIKQHLIEELSPEPPAAQYTTRLTRADVAELDDAIRRIHAAIDASGAPKTQQSPPVDISLSGREIGVLRRFLANIERVDDQEE